MGATVSSASQEASKPVTSRHLNGLLSVSAPPNQDRESWLASAPKAVDWLVNSTQSSEIILHASIGSTLITTALARLDRVSPPDMHDLEHGWLDSEHSWYIEHVSGGGQPDRVYISEPVDDHHCKSLAGGERLVFRRFFHGVDKGRTRTEISQRLVHALGLYWLKEYRSYCHLNEQGDVEPVIRVDDLGTHGSLGGVLVTINAEALHRYLAASELALVTKFDFTRVLSGSFAGWHNSQQSFAEGNLAYHFAQQSQASYANGAHLLLPLLTREDLVRQFQLKRERTDKQYATFIAHDWKNGRIAEISCAPHALASYFEKESKLPFQPLLRSEWVGKRLTRWACWLEMCL